MQKLWVKLLGAFALVIVVGVTVTVVLTRQGAATRFSHFMVGNRMVQPGHLLPLLENYYRQQGNWMNLDEALGGMIVRSSSGGTMGGMMGGMMGMFDSRVRVVDVQGRVVADSAGSPDGVLAPAEWASGQAILVAGQPVGVLLIDGVMMSTPTTYDEDLLGGVTRAVSVAALVAAGVALILGGLLIRQITRPVAQLSQVSKRITAGDLTARVVVNSRDELGQLAQTFNRMTSSLQRQEELRRQLIADIAHELRTPLSAIQGTVEALQDGVFALNAENLEPVYEQTMVLNRLVDDLRTLSLAEAGELNLNFAAVDLANLAKSRMTALQPQAHARQIDLGLETEPGLSTVLADEHRLGQVLSNLLSNALRHTPSGGSISVRLQPTSGGVQVAVIDNGEGIPHTELPYIFDRFYRADRSRNRTTGGSGLGLAIARQLVDAHGGRIWAESPPAGQNRGSAFYVSLPAGDTAKATQPRQDPTP